MRVSRLALFALVCLTWFALTISPTTVSAQSLEERYDATLAAYNSTLNQIEECDQYFDLFQQWFKDLRPPAGAKKEDWDAWGNGYRTVADGLANCLRALKKKAADLKKKLDELEKQLDSLADTEAKAPPRKESDDEKKKKAQDLLKKGEADLEKWTLNVKYKIQRVIDWSKEASDQLREHGSGKFELRFVFKF